MKSEQNLKMNILAAIGIFGVVLIHCGYEIIDTFPRWRMPMFICLSGYFFQNSNLNATISFIFRKLKKLILPVAGWQLFYGCISSVLLAFGLINYGISINLDNYLNSVFLNLGQFQFSAPLWFVPCLFYVQIVYVLLRKIYIYIYKQNEFIFTLILGGFHFGAIVASQNGYNVQWSRYILPLLYAAFYMLYFQIGFLYKSYLEKFDEFTTNKLLLPFVLNSFILAFYVDKNKLLFDAGSMLFPQTNILLPLVVSLSGIYFFLQISSLLSSKLKRNDILVLVGNNTYAIMLHHFFVFYLFNACLMVISEWGLLKKGIFDVDAFQNNLFYQIKAYNPFMLCVYVIIGVIGSIYLDRLIATIKKYIVEFVRKRKTIVVGVSLFVVICLVGVFRYYSLGLNFEEASNFYKFKTQGKLTLQCGDARFTKLGKIQEDKTVFYLNDNKDAYVLFGPYTNLPIGTYNITLFYSSNNSDSSLGVFDVSANSGKDVLQTKQILNNSNTVTLSNVNVGRKTNKQVEFRVYQYKGSSLRLRKVEIEKVK